MMAGGLAVAAAKQWPFRVYSFPTEIVKPSPSRVDIFDMSSWGKPLPGDLIYMLNRDQELAFTQLYHKVTKIDQRRKSITMQVLRGSGSSWRRA